MKQLITLLLTVGVGFSAQSQSAEPSLQKHLIELDSSMKGGKSLLTLAADFSALEVEQYNWLPYYYASYCYVMEAYKSDSSTIDSLCDKSVYYLNKADSLSDKSNKVAQSEIYCIKSLIASARITVNPNERGMKYGMKSSQMMNQAKNLNPKNPRVYFLEAQSTIYTPEAYGGGCENAKPQLKLALEKYKEFNPISELHPNWGEDEVKTILQECSE